MTIVNWDSHDKRNVVFKVYAGRRHISLLLNRLAVRAEPLFIQRQLTCPCFSHTHAHTEPRRRTLCLVSVSCLQCTGSAPWRIPGSEHAASVGWSTRNRGVIYRNIHSFIHLYSSAAKYQKRQIYIDKTHWRTTRPNGTNGSPQTIMHAVIHTGFRLLSCVWAAVIWLSVFLRCVLDTVFYFFYLFRPPGPAAAGRVGLHILLLYFLYFFLTGELIDENRPGRRPSILYQQWCPLLNS